MNDDIEKKLSDYAKAISKYTDELAQAKDRLMQDPTDANAGAVSMARERLEVARETLAIAEAEKARTDAVAKSSDYKADSKRMDEVKREADKLVGDLPTKVMDLLKYIQGIDDLAHEYNKIATRRGGVGFLSAWEYARCWHLQSQLLQWYKIWKSAQVGNPQPTQAKRTPYQKSVDDMRYRDPDRNPKSIRLTQDTSDPNNAKDTDWKGIA